MLLRIKALVRPGWVAANRQQSGPPSAKATMTARSERTASITAMTSSSRSSRLGSRSPRRPSDNPVPRASNWISRPSSASARASLANEGLVQSCSRLEK